MPQAMTLTLKLANVPRLLQAITTLNNALTKLNSSFGVTTTNVNKAADKLSKAATKLKDASRGAGTIGRIGGGKPKGVPGFNLGQGQTTGLGQGGIFSELFSIFSGNAKYAFSKGILTQIRSAFKSYAQNVYSKAGGEAGGGEAALASLGGKLAKMGLILGGIIIAIGAMVLAVKAAITAINAIKNALDQQVKLFNATGNKDIYKQLRGLQAGLNLSSEQVASAISGDPSMGRVTMGRINILRGIQDDEMASRFARRFGLEDFMQVRDMKQSTYDNMTNTRSAQNPVGRMIFTEFNASLGTVLRSLNELVASFAPLLIVVSKVLDVFNLVINAMTFFSNMLNDPLNLTGWKDSAKSMNRAADKMNKAVDSFTDKTGTFGGKDRAAGAFPQSWSYYGNQSNAIRDAINNGAFSL